VLERLLCRLRGHKIVIYTNYCRRCGRYIK
jgi:hypothetical protein